MTLEGKKQEDARGEALVSCLRSMIGSGPGVLRHMRSSIYHYARRLLHCREHIRISFR